MFIFIIFLLILNISNSFQNKNNDQKLKWFSWAPPEQRTTVPLTTTTVPTTPTVPTKPTVPPTTAVPLMSTTTAVPVLKKQARDALRSSLPGTTPEKRKKRLQTLRKKSNIRKLSKKESEVLQKKYVKANVTQNPPSLDLFEINHNAGLDSYLFEGDINLSDEQLSAYLNSNSVGSSRKKRQILTAAPFWPNKTVYYYFDAGIDSTTQSAVQGGTQRIMNQTCIRFVQNSTAVNRVKVINGVGCYSNIGMIGGEQTLSLGSGCGTYATAAHEFSHCLGVFHTQMRSDRDSFVTIDLTDVTPDLQGNFIIQTAAVSTNIIDYEYASFMHYTTNAFISSGGANSIVPKDTNMLYAMGGRIVTFMDIKMLNIHYQCLCDTDLSCGNGGYPNPNNCSQCLCPYGYGGTLCDQFPGTVSNCGKILNASNSWQQESFTFGDSTNSASARLDYMFCYYWIQAPIGKTIEFRIDSTFNTQCGYGCTYNGIEPRVKVDQTMTQPRYCCDEFNGQVIESEINPMPIIAFNRYYITTYTFSYRYANVTASTCEDLTDANTCQQLKSNNQTCTIYTNSQLKVMCAMTLGLCGTSQVSPCADRFSASDCTAYQSSGRCKSDHALVAEFTCAKSCGFCDSPV